MPAVKANGINVYYEIAGKGEPILVIGGLGIDLTQLQGLVRRLAEGHTVISFDNRGVGRSDKPDIRYTIEMMAEDASGLLSGLAVARADVIGVSLGGRVAIAMALRHPAQVKRLVLVSTSARVSHRRGVTWWLTNQLLRMPMVRSIGTKYPQPYYAYRRQRDASKGFDATGRLEEISMPALILHGTRDRTVPFGLAEEIKSGIAGSKLVPFEGGHLAVISDPGVIAQHIEGFLGETG